jgi:hypothetical protein
MRGEGGVGVAKDRQAGAKGGPGIDFLYLVRYLVVTGVKLLYTGPHKITVLKEFPRF